MEVSEGRAADRMSEWAARTTLEVSQRWRQAFGDYAAELSAWSVEHVAASAKRLPVIYPFSGADLVTAAGLFPDAPAYMLIAEFKPGQRRSLYEAAAQESALKWLGHVHARNFEFSVTREMRSFFDDVGVLPTLLLVVHLLGSSDGETSRTRVRRVVTTDAACVIDFKIGAQKKTLIYVNTFISDVYDWKRLLATPFFKDRDLGPPFSFLFKAGAHNVAREPWFSDVVLRKGHFLLQDESGLRVNAFDKKWRLSPFGNFVNFTGSQKLSYRDDATEIRNLYRTHRNNTLPFCFGYCEYSQFGTLITATKDTPGGGGEKKRQMEKKTALRLQST